MQGRGARHTACSHPRVTPGAPQHTQAHTHTHLCPPQTRDSGLQAGRHSLSVTQKRMCEILISVKPQATTFPSINTFSLVPSPVWQGRVKIFHSLKRVLRVYSSRLGRASGGFPVTGWTTRGRRHCPRHSQNAGVRGPRTPAAWPPPGQRFQTPRPDLCFVHRRETPHLDAGGGLAA